jgi:hypothetical protein
METIITTENFLAIHKPWIELPSNMLDNMIKVAEETLESPYFPEELKPLTAKMHLDLIKEKISRN